MLPKETNQPPSLQHIVIHKVNLVAQTDNIMGKKYRTPTTECETGATIQMRTQRERRVGIAGEEDKEREYE